MLPQKTASEWGSLSCFICQRVVPPQTHCDLEPKEVKLSNISKKKIKDKSKVQKMKTNVLELDFVFSYFLSR